MRITRWLSLLCLTLPWMLGAGELESARDKQDKGTLQRLVTQAQEAAQKQPGDAAAQYQLALAESMLAEVTMELREKPASQAAAERGIVAAKKAVELKGQSAEYHRILGTLCGQVIPAAGVFGGMKYGQCALDEINKAISIDPKLATAYVSRGVGNYYLPPTFGGGPEKAVADFQKAAQLDPKLGDAYLWLGITYRKLNKNTEAHEALAKAAQLNPQRVWTKQQLEKTPAK